MRPLTLGLCLLLSACGRKEPPLAYGETPEYRSWLQTQVLRRLPAANFAPREAGRIDIHPPEGRAKHPEDYCVLFVNGERIGIFRVGRMSNGTWPRHSVPVTFLAGHNTFDLWDSSSNRHYRQSVDTRQSVEFTCVPVAEGYDITGKRREP